jgi:hypothetical protein
VPSARNVVWKADFAAFFPSSDDTFDIHAQRTSNILI